VTIASRFVNWSIKRILHIILKLDVGQLKRVPKSGPMIMVVNHVNFLDAPVITVHVLPKPLTGLVKEETWKSPLLGPLFTMWGAIPIRRYEADLGAFHDAQHALMNGKILAISPEGTRSGNGKLNKGLPGVVLLSVRTGAPLLPVVYYGHENFWNNLKHFKRTPMHIVVGEPFKLNIKGIALSRCIREQVIDEIMYQLAALLPEENRGLYSDLSKATEEYLVFDVGKESNLIKAKGKLAINPPAA
jgi:1-acyl-sn-glycerol-3-phosphate acyltransferase